MAEDGARTWILTGSPQKMEPADRIVLYLTRVMRFAASVRVTGETFEDRTKLRPDAAAGVSA